MNKNSAELLQQMIDIKKDMRMAIGNKGVTVVSGMASYPSAIDKIQQEIVGGLDFSKLGYSAEYNYKIINDIQLDIDYGASKTNILEGTDATDLFNYDYELVYCPYFDTSEVTNMMYMFEGCYGLKYIPKFNTSKVTRMSHMFQNCSTINNIPLLDLSNAVDVNSMFYNCQKLTNMDGLKNIGKQQSISTTNMFIYCPHLSHDSIMNIINNLYDRASAGYSIATLPLGESNINRLSTDEIVLAINKGWILS